MPEDPRILTREENVEKIAGDLHDAIHDAACLVDFEGRTIGWAPEDSIPLMKAALLKFSDDEQTAQRERIATLEADNRRLREVLQKHHQWHLDIGTVMVSSAPNPNGNDELVELDLTDAYSDSSLCQETLSALQPAAPPTCKDSSPVQPAAPQLSGEAEEKNYCARCGSALSIEPGSDTGFRCDACGWADALGAEPTTEKQG